jgi:hypothetical protein
MNPLFIQSYIQAAASRLLPPMLPCHDPAARLTGMMGMSEAETQAYAPIMQKFEHMGLPMIGDLLMMPPNEPNPQKQMKIAKDLPG